jgi:hypothetical protein
LVFNGFKSSNFLRMLQTQWHRLRFQAHFPAAMTGAIAHTEEVRVCLSIVGSTFTGIPSIPNQAKLKYERAAHATSGAIEAARP